MTTSNIRWISFPADQLRLVVDRLPAPENSNELPHAGRLFRAADMVRMFRIALAGPAGPANALWARFAQDVAPVMYYEGNRSGGRSMITGARNTRWVNGRFSHAYDPTETQQDLVSVQGAPSIIVSGRVVVPAGGDTNRKTAFGTRRNGQVGLAWGRSTWREFADAMLQNGFVDAVGAATGDQAVLITPSGIVGSSSAEAPLWLVQDAPPSSGRNAWWIVVLFGGVAGYFIFKNKKS